MSTTSKPSKDADQLDPLMASWKKGLERAGFPAVHDAEIGWIVMPPEGVRFLSIRPPKNPAYKRIDNHSFAADEDWNQYWDSLPEAHRHMQEWSRAETEYYHLDPKAKDEWDRFSMASNNLWKVLFDTLETREEFDRDAEKRSEDYEDDCDDEDRYFVWLLRSMSVNGSFACDGLNRFLDAVYAVLWEGDFPVLHLNGCEIESVPYVRLNGSGPRSVIELHEYDANKLSLRLMAHNYPDLILSSSEELSGNTEVNWVLPGLVEQEGMTLTYAGAKRGKTTLVLRELWRACQQGRCNVIFLAFEGHNGLGSHVAAVKEQLGSCPTFAVQKVHWNLSEPADWESARNYVADMKQALDTMQDAPTVVVFDTIGSALKTGSRITGAPEVFLGEAKRLQYENGIALWFVSHQNDKGALYGFKGFEFDADIVTRIIRKSNGRDHVHKRLLGRHVESEKNLCTFRIEEFGPGIVAVDQNTAATIDESDSSVVPDLAKSYQPLIPLLDEAGTADGITEAELREVLNHQLAKPGLKQDTLRQQRLRAKKALLDASVLIKLDDMYFLGT